MKKLILMSVCIIFLEIYLFSSENSRKTLDLSEAINLSLINNLDIKIEKLNLDRNKWSLATVWNMFVPDVRINTSKVVNLPPVVENAKNKDSIKDYLLINVNAGLNINTDLIFNINKIKIDWEKGNISYEMAKKKLEKEVKTLYFTLIILEKNIKLIERRNSVSKKRFDFTDLQSQTGIVSELEKLKAEFAYESSKTELLNASNLYEESLMNFKNILGIKQDVELVLITMMEINKDFNPDIDSLYSKLMQNNLDIKLLKINLNEDINQLNLHISSYTPTLKFSFNYNPLDDFYPEQVSSDSKLSSKYFTFTLSVPLSPFVPLSKENMKILSTGYQIKQNRYMIEKLINEKIIELKQNIKKLLKSKTNMNAYEINVSMAEKIYRMTEASYEKGLISMLDVIIAEENFYEASLNLLNAQYEYLTVIFNLEFLINQYIYK